MTSVEWIREYEREKKEFVEMFDSNGEPIFDDPKFFDTYVENFPFRGKENLFFMSSHIRIISRLNTY